MKRFLLRVILGYTLANFVAYYVLRLFQRRYQAEAIRALGRALRTSHG